MEEYKVWECKIVVSTEAHLPEGFDWPPRRAAISSVEAEGIQIITCFSGWGGSLTDSELDFVIMDSHRKENK
jgi:hypothetical protein